MTSMTTQQFIITGTTQEMTLSHEEEEFLIEAEKAEQKKPCFDARALRQMGLMPTEAQMLQVFFMKARGAGFNVNAFTQSECLAGLVSALKYLPKTNETGKITVESYKASDCTCNETGTWSDKFRHEFAHAMIWSHKERREPVLLDVLRKVFDWIEKFQKAHGLYVELPQWLQNGMAGDFETDDDMAEAEQPSEMATDKQKALLTRLIAETNSGLSFDFEKLTKQQATEHITGLMKGTMKAEYADTRRIAKGGMISET